MPYKAATKEVPDCFPCYNHCCLGHVFWHGNCLECCCCTICCALPCCELCCNLPCCVIKCEWCKIDCLQCSVHCAGCKPFCQVPCDLLLQCENFCKQDCQLGPEIAFKSVGLELCCGVASVEAVTGIFHVATDICPAFCPTVICKDEKKDGDLFIPTPGEPHETYKCTLFKCCLSPCLGLPCCAPHTHCATGPCGICLDPLFNGQTPWWFCNENKLPTIELKMTTCGEGPCLLFPFLAPFAADLAIKRKAKKEEAVVEKAPAADSAVVVEPSNES